MKFVQTIPELTKIFSNSPILKYKRGGILTNTEDLNAVWLVVKGYIKRYEILSNGAIRTQGFYGPGDIFPLTYVFLAVYKKQIYYGPETYYYEALSESEVQRIPGKLLLDRLQKQPLIYRDLLSVAGDRFLSNIQLLENHGLTEAHKRLAHLLYSYAQRYAHSTSNGMEISLPLTQQDNADILGLSRETISTSMQHLKKRELIFGLKKITVPSMENLREFAYK